MRATSLFSLLAAGLAASVLLVPLVAHAFDPFLLAPADDVVERAPSFLYAHMSSQQALAELDRRNILYQRVEAIGRVRTPIRLTGKLHDVHIHSALPESERPTTVFEICDARLALALDDFSKLLAKHDVVELVHYTMYRPAPGNQPTSALAPAWLMPQKREWQTTSDAAAKVSKARKPTAAPPASGTVARRASPPASTSRATTRTAPGKASANGRKAPAPPAAATGARRGSKRPVRSKGARNAPPPRPAQRITNSRHPDGLAIDLGSVRKRDGTVVSVASHFQGTIGAPTCTPGASRPADARGQLLWQVVCEAYEQKIFTYVLTPNYDQPHQDHLHMEIKPGVRWFLYH